MNTRPAGEAPFDEQKALAELERVRDQIQAYRAQRRAVQDEFGRFVRSFKEPLPVVAAEPPDPTLPAAAPSFVAPAPPAPPPPVHAQAPLAPTSAVPSTIAEEHASAVELEPFSAATPAASGRPMALAAVAALLLLAFGAWIFWPESGAAPTTAGETPPAAESTANTPPEPAAPAPAAAPARGTELVTIRAVWMRVIVDGTRVIEREVPADTKIPLNPRESLVIRAGNGAAVRLTLAGEDQGFLGREGQPITRTFTVPAERR